MPKNDAPVVAERDDAEALRQRRMYDEITAEAHHVHDWAGLEHTGTIAVVLGAEALLHIGRHDYVRLDVARDLHGVVPRQGAFVSLDKQGRLAETQRPHDRGIQQERVRER